MLSSLEMRVPKMSSQPTFEYEPAYQKARRPEVANTGKPKEGIIPHFVVFYGKSPRYNFLNIKVRIASCHPANTQEEVS
jgi:hypothetical protein